MLMLRRLISQRYEILVEHVPMSIICYVFVNRFRFGARLQHIEPSMCMWAVLPLIDAVNQSDSS